MNKIYRVAHGFEFDVDGYIMSKYLFFDNLDDARTYCDNVARETGQILNLTETDENFKKFYYQRVGKYQLCMFYELKTRQ